MVRLLRDGLLCLFTTAFPVVELSVAVLVVCGLTVLLTNL